MQNLYSSLNDLISTYKQNLDNFDRELTQAQTPNQLDSLQLEKIFSVLESNSAQLAETQKKELEAKVIQLKLDFKHKLISKAQTLCAMAKVGVIEHNTELKAQRLITLAENSLHSPNITDNSKQQLLSIIKDLNNFFETCPYPLATVSPSLKKQLNEEHEDCEVWLLPYKN